MKRFIMPLSAFLVVGTVFFTGCGNKDEAPEQEAPVVDTMATPTTPAPVDTAAVTPVDTAAAAPADTAKKPATTAGKGGKTQSGPNKNMNTSADGLTGTKKPQREDKPAETAPTTNEPVKTESPSNTTAKKAQRP